MSTLTSCFSGSWNSQEKRSSPSGSGTGTTTAASGARHSGNEGSALKSDSVSGVAAKTGARERGVVEWVDAEAEADAEVDAEGCSSSCSDSESDGMSPRTVSA